MIPLKDENPTEITPYVTVLLVLANLAAWFVYQGAGLPDGLVTSVESFGFRPCEITGQCAGAGLAGPSVFTSMFMHASWGHLLGNLLFLWVFGNNIEDSMGHFRFVAFYRVCGVAAAAAHIASMPGSVVPAVGASGAISGIMGAYVVLYPRVRVLTWFPPFFFFSIRAFFLLGYWFLLQVAVGTASLGPEAAATGGVAVWAHVGGFVAGLLLIRAFRKPELTFAKSHKIRLPPDEARRLKW